MKLNRVLTHGLPSSSWGYPGESGLVAYFSMEIAITPAMPTYSGGLGVLAGDTLRAAADAGLRLAAVTLDGVRLIDNVPIPPKGDGDASLP